MVAGPSEILVIADGACNPQIVAADLLSQAEHDKNASAVLVTDSEALALAVQGPLMSSCPSSSGRRLPGLHRPQRQDHWAQSLDTAVDIANEIAPSTWRSADQPFRLPGQDPQRLPIFLGRNCPEALGTTFAGPNHTLPTSGTARFSSPCRWMTFVKKMQYTYYTKPALRRPSSPCPPSSQEGGPHRPRPQRGHPL